jgi:anaphase-promoting complex subunit 4
VLKHVFASTGPKAKPVYIDVNGRKGRRAVCALYGDAMRYEVLDLDAAIDEEEVDEVGDRGEREEIGSEEEEADTEN